MSLELLRAYEKLNSKDQAAVRDIVAKAVTEKWIPQPGPQTDAYFCKADELLFGGSAGGGKSDLLIGLAINCAHNAVIFRNGLKNLRDLEGRALAVLQSRLGFNSHTHVFNLGGTRTLELDSLELPGSELNWQGRRRDTMLFDEASQSSRYRVQFVLGWAGSAQPGIRTRVVFATNPPVSDEGVWLLTWFAPWLNPLFENPARSGELRWFVNNQDGDPIWVEGPGSYDRGDGKMSTAKSRTFIPSSLDDNRYLRDTSYRSQLEALAEPLRSAVLSGNFMAARVDHENQLFPSEWISKAQARWKPEGERGVMLSLGVDVAGGGRDREVIARLHANNWYAPMIVNQGVDTKDGSKVGGRILTAQRNGAPIGIDMTGGWGGASREFLKQAEIDVHGVIFSAASGANDTGTRIPFGNYRAELFYSFRDALDPLSGEHIALPPDPRLAAELAAPRRKLKGGKLYVESKEEIFTRLGASTDNLDAVLIAWSMRARGVAKRMQKSGRLRASQSAVNDNPYAIDGF